ncbi:hypothetical protein DFQ15_11614 [Xylophilus ampelinus]|uniref:Metallo-beta-lactamase superfamily protein n=1 Tax=Xylophilus ampelinus TaxID=54067 RepID=A0A318SJ88_9BURK|nr:hypothetical protein DFQ15_11614 [Xylophilus ampelinus]
MPIAADALRQKGFGVLFPEIADARAFAEVAATPDTIDTPVPALAVPGHGTMFQHSFFGFWLVTILSNPCQLQQEWF